MTKAQAAGSESDVFAVWRELYDANEKAWTTALEQTMSTSEFGESSGRLLETMLAAQKSVRENMRAYLETMNVPTREDIARLGELVVGLEEKSDQILDRLDVLEADVQGRSRDSARLDQIAKGLEAIERAVRGRAAEVAKIDRIAKRIDVIERAVRSRTTAAGKPSEGTSRTAAARASAPKATAPANPTAVKPTSRTGKAATPATGPVA